MNVYSKAEVTYVIIHVAGRSAMSLAGPGYLNAEASSAYRQLSGQERERLRQEADTTEKTLTKREVTKRGEKIFTKIQNLVTFNSALFCVAS